jgi:outer membrane lipoprotein-sorting protein
MYLKEFRHVMRKTLWTLALSVFSATLLASVAAHAADTAGLADTLKKLDASSAKFKSAEADLSVDNTQVNPIPDTDTQTGTVVFERKNGQLSMAMHLKTDNGKPVPKDAVYSGGQFKLYEPLLKQMQVFKAGSSTQVDSFLALGFGASGQDLQKNWVVSYDGSEQISGIATAKLELVPRDPEVKKNVVKVILWVDLDKGIALRQQSFDAAGNYRLANYKIQHLNGSIPGNAFEVKTPPDTHIVNR